MPALHREQAHGSWLGVQPTIAHVDIYSISVRERLQRLVARITLENGAFAVHASGETEKRILARLDSCASRPVTLDDLGLVFDAPQLLASPVHSMRDCPFGCSGSEVPLLERKPSLQLL